MKKIIKEELVKNLENNQTFVVKFEADWCGPCKMMTHTFNQIGEELQESYPNVGSYFFNIDNDVEYAKSFSIRGVPTMIGFKNGKEVSRKVGLLGEQQIKEFYSAL